MKTQGIAFLVIVVLFLVSCSKKIAVNQEEALRKEADRIAHQYPLIDGHVDLPYRLKAQNFRLTKEYIGIPLETKEGDFDYKRAKQGGLSAPFMSIYIPSDYQKNGGAKELADSLINMIEGIASAHPDKFSVTTSTSQLQSNFSKGLISLPLGMENGAAIQDNLENVDYFYKRGIRYITLTHGKDNLICDSSYDTTQTWNGVSPFGRKVIGEMNRLGIMVDVSHISDSAFYQVMKLTKVPCIASHSSCRFYTPNWQRNMSDDMIRALGKNGGVIQINFGSTFLDSKVPEYQNKKRTELRNLLDSKGLKEESPEAKPIIEEFRKKNPKLYSDVEMVANHIDRVVKLAGIDHVGVGSDFDGVGDSLPTGLKDVSQYPNLVYVLLKRGYKEADIAKILSGNVLRVWSQVETFAKK